MPRISVNVDSKTASTDTRTGSKSFPAVTKKFKIAGRKKLVLRETEATERAQQATRDRNDKTNPLVTIDSQTVSTDPRAGSKSFPAVAKKFNTADQTPPSNMKKRSACSDNGKASTRGDLKKNPLERFGSQTASKYPRAGSKSIPAVAKIFKMAGCKYETVATPPPSNVKKRSACSENGKTSTRGDLKKN